MWDHMASKIGLVEVEHFLRIEMPFIGIVVVSGKVRWYDIVT